jgi:deferrochelatase/peroxidase EfeB
MVPVPDRARVPGAWARRRPGVPIRERGPGASFRPDDAPPSVFGRHQPGVAAPVLEHVALTALDVTAQRREELRELLGALTDEAQRLMATPPRGAVTATVGLGPALFDRRFNLGPRRPVALADLPAFPGDALDPARCGGDLCLQACAADPAGAARALAQLVAVAAPAARVRWAQAGSMHRPPEERPPAPPRNLLGFKDATSNPRRGKDLDRFVWIGGRDRTWMLGGTYLVVRRVQVLLDGWDALGGAEQERVIGRDRRTGAPLGRTHPFDPLPPGDDPVAPDAHTRVMAPRRNQGISLLRRGYSYEEPPGRGGERDAGILLLFYQRDPRRQFVPLQRRFADQDALRHHTRTTASAVFAIPPGAAPGRALAHPLLDGALRPGRA